MKTIVLLSILMLSSCASMQESLQRFDEGHESLTFVKLSTGLVTGMIKGDIKACSTLFSDGILNTLESYTFKWTDSGCEVTIEKNGEGQ